MSVARAEALSQLAIARLPPAAGRPERQGGAGHRRRRLVWPGLPHRVVGIRPGEKLHEVMVPEDDARSTVELEDRYLILPSHDPARRSLWLEQGARELPEGFSYASDRNPERLDAQGLQHLLARAFGGSGRYLNQAPA
jgi:hypothetical protein